jgi:D-glycero-D-manno-heptose 1,7-bisphosphate phosphatase
MAKAPTQAVILAGGLGTRLGEVTKVTPKPLVPVLDVPFLHHLIGNVVRHGFTDIVLLCGYMAEKFDVLTEPGVFGEATVRLSIEPPGLLGTGGAVRHAAPLLDERFLLMNGDTFFDINLLDLCTEPDDGAWMRMALRREPAAGRYGSVALEDGRVTGFDASAEDGDGLINGGVYCMDRRVLGEIGPGACSIERDVFPVLARAGRGGSRGVSTRAGFSTSAFPWTWRAPMVSSRPFGPVRRPFSTATVFSTSTTAMCTAPTVLIGSMARARR